MSIYGKTLFFKRGITVTLFLNFACNLHCAYCTNRRFGEVKSKTMTLPEWKDRIKEITRTFNVKEFYITGGEPTLVPYFSELVDWLLCEGYHVLVFSNLYDIRAIEECQNFYRLKIWATYHAWDDPLRFNHAYQDIKHTYEVQVGEIDTPINYKYFEYSRWMELEKDENLKSNSLRVAPDGKLYLSCWELLKDKTCSKD